MPGLTALESGRRAGLEVGHQAHVDALVDRNHYIKTLGLWAEALERNKDEAIATTDEENYHRYMRYLRGCQHYFIDESIDVSLVTYLKPGAAG